jgi:hypothetical protein
LSDSPERQVTPDAAVISQARRRFFQGPRS